LYAILTDRRSLSAERVGLDLDHLELVHLTAADANVVVPFVGFSAAANDVVSAWLIAPLSDDARTLWAAADMAMNRPLPFIGPEFSAGFAPVHASAPGAVRNNCFFLTVSSRSNGGPNTSPRLKAFGFVVLRFAGRSGLLPSFSRWCPDLGFFRPGFGCVRFSAEIDRSPPAIQDRRGIGSISLNRTHPIPGRKESQSGPPAAETCKSPSNGRRIEDAKPNSLNRGWYWSAIRLVIQSEKAIVATPAGR